MSGEAISSAEAMKNCNRELFEPLAGDETHLLLDFDTAQDWANFMPRLAMLEDFYPVKYVHHWDSKTPGHKHAVVTLETKLAPLERLALEAALGSDGKRTILGLNRFAAGDQTPSVLFMPKGVKPSLLKGKL